MSEALNKKLGLSAGLVGVAIGTGWTADAAAALIRVAPSELPPLCSLLWMMAGIGTLLGSAWWLYHLRDGLIVGQATRKDSTLYRHHTLIMGLSPFNGKEEDGKKLSDLSFEDAVSKNEIRLNWQQPLRVIWRHIQDDRACGGETLKRIYILPSSSALNSQKTKCSPILYPDGFVSIVKEKLEKEGRGDIEVCCKFPSVDYENMNDVIEGMSSLVKKARQVEGSSVPDGVGICLDITAGQKIFSIAAALVTMNRGVNMGYVTNDGEPVLYTARIGLASEFGS